MLFPAQLYTTHRGINNTRLLSPRIWSQVGNSMLAPDGYSGGYFILDDFRGFGIGTAVTSNVGYYVGEAGTYYSFEDTGGAIAQLATERTGAVRLSVDADDNQETWLQYGNATSVSSVISTTSGADKFLAFECRFRPNDVVGNRFVGLAEEGAAANSFIADDGLSIADKDYIGFYALEATPTVLNFGYKKASQTAQLAITTAGTLAAATWIKVGFVYNPAAPPSRRLTVFVNNEENVTALTATNLAAATFPNGEELSPIFGVKNVTDIMTQDTDWFALYQAD